MSRARTATIASAAAATLSLAACGGSDSGGGSGDSASGSAGAGFPATVQTKFGKTEIKEAPKRVVALGWGDAETALALGVQPVGQSDWLAFGGNGVGPWAKGKYDKAPTKIETLKPSYEKIASLKPDVILDVKSSGDAERYKRLSQIAPTVAVPKGGETYLTSMNQQVTMIAKALGKEEKGKQLLSDVDKRFAAARKANPEFAGKTATVAAYTSEGWGAYVRKNERVQFMTRLGFKPNPKIDSLKAEGFSAKVSQEKLNVLDSDLLVVFPIYKPATEVTKNSVYQQIPAVKKKHDVVFTDKQDDIRQAYATNSVLSVPYALKEATPLFAKALNGQGG